MKKEGGVDTDIPDFIKTGVQTYLQHVIISIIKLQQQLLPAFYRFSVSTILQTDVVLSVLDIIKRATPFLTKRNSHNTNTK